MVEYRIAEEKEYKNINDFHNRIYSSNRTLDQFYWEFHNCPVGKSIYVVAVDGDKIVGTNCVIPIELIDSNKQIILSGKSEDTLVDPEYRGQKIFYKIYDFLFKKCKEQGIKVIWGFTSAEKPFKNLGFSIPVIHQQSLTVNKVLPSFKYLSGLNIHNKLLDKLKIFGLCIYSKSKTLLTSNKSILDKYIVSEDKKIIKGVGEIIESNLKLLDSLFAINQFDEFQKWRIYDNPNYYKVHTYGFYDNSNILKALIVINSHSNKVAYISQSSFHFELPENEVVEMIKYATNKVFKLGITLLRNWQFNHNIINKKEIEFYDRAGHIILQRGVGLVWKELENIELKPKMFYLSRIATQGVI